MPIDKLSQHYSFTNPASIHDEEALTALELAGRQGAKINEVIEAQNTLDKETREYNEKTRLEVVPAAVNAEFNKRISSGEFADEINEYAGDLRSRVNHMFENVPEGSTTMDAEVIDARLTGRGMPAPSLRESIVLQISLAQESMFKKTKISLSTVSGSVWRVDNNTAYNTTSGQYARYDFNGEKIVCVTGRDYSFDWYPFAAFFDEDDNCIFNGWGGVAYTSRYNVYLAVPSNAKYMIINGATNRPNCEAYACETMSFPDAVRYVDYISPTRFSSYAPDGHTVEVKYPLTESNTEKLYARTYASDGYFTKWETKETIYSTLYLPLDPSWISINLREYNIGSGGGAFVDENKSMLQMFATNHPNHLEDKIIPEGARYIAITVKDSSPYHNIYINMPSFRLMGLRESGSAWSGKKVVWLGTSIPWGQGAEKSYAQELSNFLGFELVPAFAPGLAIHTDNGQARTYGSSVLSIAEYNSQGIDIPSDPPAWSPGSGNSYYYRTWENVFNSKNADADLYVFDVIPNNGNWSTSDWDLFDKENWTYNDGSSFASHRNTFLGAMIFLMDKMYQCNPNARMVLLIGAGTNKTGWSNFEILSEAFNIPIINAWKSINTTPKSKTQILNSDGVHISTFAHERIGRMLIGEFMRLA